MPLLTQRFRYVPFYVYVPSFKLTHLFKLALALSNAETWCIEHNGLNFSQMYEVIVDFFEDVQKDQNVDKKKRRHELLAWWNK